MRHELQTNLDVAIGHLVEATIFLFSIVVNEFKSEGHGHSLGDLIVVQRIAAKNMPTGRLATTPLSSITCVSGTTPTVAPELATPVERYKSWPTSRYP